MIVCLKKMNHCRIFHCSGAETDGYFEIPAFCSFFHLDAMSHFQLTQSEGPVFKAPYRVFLAALSTALHIVLITMM
jgi:hypothetical protein